MKASFATNIEQAGLFDGYGESEPDFRYPGGKGVCYQQIINQMPPHDTYIETHLGAGAVIRNKRPAGSNIAIDIDPAVHRRFDKKTYHYIKFFIRDAVSALEKIEMRGYTVIYADPPYLPETRKKLNVYEYEYTAAQHLKLLRYLKQLSSPYRMIIVSGYYSQLYARELAGWRTQTFETKTRGGVATEWLWMNYPQPTELHDYRHLGDDFRARERIRRKQRRWIANLKRMPALERRAMVELINKEV